MFYAKRVSEIRDSLAMNGFYDEATVLTEAKQAVLKATNEDSCLQSCKINFEGSPPGSPKPERSAATCVERYGRS